MIPDFGPAAKCSLRPTIWIGVFERRDRQGALPRIQVVYASTGKALPHGRASDFRFFRLFGARIVSPFQGFVAAWSCLPRAALRGWRRFVLPWAYLFRPLRGEFYGGPLGANSLPSVHGVARRRGVVS